MAQNTSNPNQDLTKDKSVPAKLSFMVEDFPLIRKALIVLVASMLLGVALVGTGKTIMLIQKNDMNQAQAQLSDALNKRRQVETDKQDINDYQAKYMQLRERGFVGEEKRLDWIANIKSIRESRKLSPITYEIAAQQVFPVDSEVATAELELRGSKMKLQIDLLHEGDLFNFLDDLKIKGLYTVQACTLKRLGAGTTAATPQSPHLAAECNLYWLTLGERNDNQNAPPPTRQPIDAK